MLVEVWSDVVCPWCYVGKRRLEQALSRFAHTDEVIVRWRSFELDPEAPAVLDEDLVTHIAAKYGLTREQSEASQRRLGDLASAEGLDFRFEQARPGNTFDAHRLLHLAEGEGTQGALKERLLHAYFTEGEAVGQREVLARLAVEAGLDAVAVRGVLDGTAFAEDVRADEQHARAAGVSGVPFFVVDGRYAVEGAQSSDVLLQALDLAWQEQAPRAFIPVGGPGASCDGDACDV